MSDLPQAAGHLFQCHWQNPQPDSGYPTEFVAQSGFTEAEVVAGRVHEWATEVFERRKDEMPEGWCPMVCTQDAPCFVMAAKPPAGVP